MARQGAPASVNST